MRLLLLILVLMTSTAVWGQKPPIKFGDIPMEDMEMTVYPKDTSASAVVLADYGIAYVSIAGPTPTLNFERIRRVKILTREGLKYADASIPLFHTTTGEETITGLKAATYNLENGKIVETRMAKDAVFTEKFNRYFNLKKFSLPNVKEGSVIEYSYTVRSDYIINFPNWEFQSTIPTRISEYWAMIPEFFIMERYMQGYVTATEYKEDTRPRNDYIEKTFHWVIRDVPAFKEEPYMTSKTDYISRINFALSQIIMPGQPIVNVVGTWQKLAKDLLESESFGKIVYGSSYTKKFTEELVGSETDPQKKIEMIFAFVQKQIEWDKTNDFLARSPKEVFDERKGSSGDINLILASMLEKAGFEVDLVVLSTRDHGFVRQQYPMARQFDYVICRLAHDGKYFLIDATEKHLPFGIIPERCLNGEGLIVSPKNTGWVELTSRTKARSVISADMKLVPDGELTGTLAYTRDGYDALKIRNQFNRLQEEAYQKQLQSERPTWNISNVRFEHLGILDKPVKTTLELGVEENVDDQGQMIYINPFIEGRLTSNPFVSESRLYPVDFARPEERIYMCKLTIPDGYAVDEVPGNRILSLPNGAARYTFSVTPNGNILNVYSNFQINQNLFTQEDYPLLREFYNQVVAKQAEQIVLKKK